MADNKPKVLVVDDEPSIAKVVRKQLEVAGYEVEVAIDGQDGLDKAKSWNPTLIVLDVMIPKIDGHGVCRALKQDEKYRRIPILMLTAKAQRQDYQEAMQQGAEAYLTKPFELQELLEKVRALIQGASAGSTHDAAA
jgi:DNA-binding response OmpR family regulator